jgi:hypothetical protein
VATGNKSTLKNLNDIILFIEENFYKVKDDGALEKTMIDKKNINLNVYVDSPNFSLIPEEIFKNISTTEKNSFLTPNVSEYSFFEKFIPELNAYLIWAEEKKVIEKLLAAYPTITTHHFSESFLHKKQHINGIEMFLDKSFIYITAFKNQHIQLINRFEINNEDDVLYYLLSVIKEADLINEEFKIVNYSKTKNNIRKQLIDIFKVNQEDFYANKSLKEINL